MTEPMPLDRFEANFNVAEGVLGSMEASLPSEMGAACTGNFDQTRRELIESHKLMQHGNGATKDSSCHMMSSEEDIADGGGPDKYSSSYLGKTSNTSGITLFPDHTPCKQSKADKPESMDNYQYQAVTELRAGPVYIDPLPQVTSGAPVAGVVLPQSHQNVYSQQLPSPTVDSLPSSTCLSNQQLHTVGSYDQIAASSKSRHCYGQQDTVPQDPNFLYEYTGDLGYSSHSTESSSCQGQDKDSQTEGSAGGQGSQLDLNAVVGGVGCWHMDGGTRVYQHGDNELEDLLYHFQKFFQDRFETELQQFRESVHDMIAEQQTHVRQIVHRAMAEHNSQTPSDELLEDTGTPAASTNNTLPTDANQDPSSNNSGVLTIHPLTSLILNSMGPTRANLTAESTKRQAHLELMSLSCSVSTLLTRTEFRS